MGSRVSLAVLGVLICVCLLGCTKPEKTRRILEAKGFTKVVITGYRWYGCPKDDDFVTGFTAIGVNGQPISGVSCDAWFWGSMKIRFF